MTIIPPEVWSIIKFCFLPGNALPSLHPTHLQLLYLCGSFYLQLCLQCLKRFSIGLGSGDQLNHWRIFNFFSFKMLSCFSNKNGHCEAPSCQFCSIWLNVSRENRSIDFRNHFPTSVKSHIIAKHQWDRSSGSHSCHVITLSPPCFTHDVVYFGSWALHFLLHTSIPIILIQAYIDFTSHISEYDSFFLHVYRQNLICPSCSSI